MLGDSRKTGCGSALVDWIGKGGSSSSIPVSQSRGSTRVPGCGRGGSVGRDAEDDSAGLEESKSIELPRDGVLPPEECLWRRAAEGLLRSTATTSFSVSLSRVFSVSRGLSDSRCLSASLRASRGFARANVDGCLDKPPYLDSRAIGPAPVTFCERRPSYLPRIAPVPVAFTPLTDAPGRPSTGVPRI